MPNLNLHYNINNKVTIIQNTKKDQIQLTEVDNNNVENIDLKSKIDIENQTISQNIKYIYYVTRDFNKRFGTKRLYYNKEYFKQRKLNIYVCISQEIYRKWLHIILILNCIYFRVWIRYKNLHCIFR